jgi:hypothetical protein
MNFRTAGNSFRELKRDDNGTPAETHRTEEQEKEIGLIAGISLHTD